ncbi:hypothetical protein GOODEAATRI_011678, partial [Goodea atripinnis]
CQVNAETADPVDELSPEAVELCRKLGSNATRVSEIAGGRDRAVHAAIQEGINKVNEKATSNAQRVQKWIILDRDFSVGGGELGQCHECAECSVFLWLHSRLWYLIKAHKLFCPAVNRRSYLISHNMKVVLKNKSEHLFSHVPATVNPKLL